jgi:opacity protein-like surface antigen
VGVIGSAHTTGAIQAIDYGLGAEVGYLVAKNVWVTAGYNFLGFEARDFDQSEDTNPGVYLRLRAKFDEDLFRWLQP